MFRTIQALITARRTKAPMICAITQVDGQPIPVEIETVMAGNAFVTALPRLLEDGTLWPVFPFPDPFGMDVPWSTAELPLTSLSNISVQEA